MAETTAEFQSVNAAVRAAEAQLAGRLSRPDLAALLRAVQEGERDKLRFTLVLQVTSPINSRIHRVSFATCFLLYNFSPHPQRPKFLKTQVRLDRFCAFGCCWCIRDRTM